MTKQNVQFLVLSVSKTGVHIPHRWTLVVGIGRLSLEVDTAQREISSYEETHSFVYFSRFRFSAKFSEKSHFSLNDLGQLHRLSKDLDQILAVRYITA